MKTAIVGAGISGLTIAQLIKDRDDVTLYESQSRPGGLCKCDYVDGNLFHLSGGHCFNSKDENVIQWFWRFFSHQKKSFSKVKRNAAVCLADRSEVQYPIENHLYQLPLPLQKAVVKDLLAVREMQLGEPKTFDQFLKQRFGQTLYDVYFEPYNRKIWQKELKDVPLEWLAGKLPMPSVEDILLANFNHEDEEIMVHSSFYVSKCGGSQFLIDHLSKGLNISCDHPVTSIRRVGNKWYIDKEPYERVIFCGNSTCLADVITGLDTSPLQGLHALEYHGTTSVLCYMEQNPYTWIYMPSSEHKSHRIICTGNYWHGNNASERLTGIVEFSEKMSRNEIEHQLSLIPYSPQYIAHHYEECTYPMQNSETRKLVEEAKRLLEPNEFYLLGRFAEWEYYNMDAAIGAAINLNERLKQWNVN